ncbi:hypothetical protein GCM10025762_46940 [Haloechinothrix salitolerans]
MEPFPSAPHHRDEVGPFEDVEVLRRRLACHVEAFTQLSQRLTVALLKRPGVSGGLVCWGCFGI